jgi:hypothetical protein
MITSLAEIVIFCGLLDEARHQHGTSGSRFPSPQAVAATKKAALREEPGFGPALWDKWPSEKN